MIRQTLASAQQVPLNIHLVQDVSGSTQSDLPTIQYETQRFVENVSRRYNPYDLMRISSFSGYTIYDQLEFDSLPGYFQPANRMLSQDAFNRMKSWNSKGMTAIYDAVIVAHQDLQGMVRQIPFRSLNIVIVITDGYDNASKKLPSEMGFPNSYTHLAAIGVGSCSQSSLQTLSNYATSTHHIYSFNDLFQALSVVLLKVQQRVIY